MFFEESHNSTLVPSMEVQKIMSYSELPVGWDYGVGSAPSVLTIDRAIEIYEKFSQLGFGVDSTPMTNGGITLTFDKGIFFVDVIINPENIYDIREEEGIGVDYNITNQESNVTLERIEEILNATIQKCLLLEPSISENTLQASEDFKATALIITETEYLSSTESVPYITPVQSANT